MEEAPFNNLLTCKQALGLLEEHKIWRKVHVPTVSLLRGREACLQGFAGCSSTLVYMFSCLSVACAFALLSRQKRLLPLQICRGFKQQRSSTARTCYKQRLQKRPTNRQHRFLDSNCGICHPSKHTNIGMDMQLYFF